MAPASSARSLSTGGEPRPAVVIGVIAASGLVLLGLALGMWVTTPPIPQNPAAYSGPYRLNSSTPVIGLSFPDCSIVKVDWHVVAGLDANFSVMAPSVGLPANCSGPFPHENLTCPQQGSCAWYGETPVCLESGTAGSCSFMSIQPAYGFNLFEPVYGQEIGNLSVSFTASYAPNPR